MSLCQVYHPNKENYQRNSENNFFGTAIGYLQIILGGHFFDIGSFVLPTQILGNLLLPIEFENPNYYRFNSQKGHYRPIKLLPIQFPLPIQIIPRQNFCSGR